MTSARCRLALALLGALGAACSSTSEAPPATEIVVEVYTDMPSPSQLNRMELAVTTPATATPVFSGAYPLGSGPGERLLPARITLVPADDGNPEITVNVQGYLGADTVVANRATISFERGRSLLLRLGLLRACRPVACPSTDDVCGPGGACGPIKHAPGSLPAFDPAQPPLHPDTDGGDRVDAPVSPPDAPEMDAAPVDLAPPGDASVDAPATGSDAADAPAPADGRADAGDATVMPMDGPNKPPGAACAAGGECGSGICVDKVCCKTKCDGLCESCAVTGSVGTCAATPAGTDPRSQCDEEGNDSCKQDGTCDGNRACRLYRAGTTCSDATCAGSTHTLVGTCDGKGTCKPGPQQSCAPFKCGANDNCLTTCTDSNDCVAPGICTNGSCGKKSSGQPCNAPGECASNFCEQGFCCGTACSSTCKSCGLMGSEGVCTNVPDGSDPLDHCGIDNVTTCARDGFCNGMGACRLYAASTQCVPPMCANGVATVARFCDGVGKCAAATTTMCGAYVCAPDACKTTCSGNGDCAPGNHCQMNTMGSGACVPNMAENCTNGVDDDGDGNIDCADSDCGGQGFTCVAPPPAGWTGPVAFHEGQFGLFPACGTNYPSVAYDGKGGNVTCQQVTCSDCSYSHPTTPGKCSPPPVAGYYADAMCATLTSKMALPVDCAQAPAAGTLFRVPATPIVATPGTCAPSGGAVATRPTPTWATSARACGGAGLTAAGCAAGALCAPPAGNGFESKLCVLASGNLVCPSGYQGLRRLYHGGALDSRTCQACSTQPAVGEDCTGSVEFYSSLIITREICSKENLKAAYKLPIVACTKTVGTAFQYHDVVTGGSCPGPIPDPADPNGTCAPDDTTLTTVCCQP
jgi:hypothetical protein